MVDDWNTPSRGAACVFGTKRATSASVKTHMVRAGGRAQEEGRRTSHASVSSRREARWHRLQESSCKVETRVKDALRGNSLWEPEDTFRRPNIWNKDSHREVGISEEIRLEMNTSDAKEYLARREIPQLFEVRGCGRFVGMRGRGVTIRRLNTGTLLRAWIARVETFWRDVGCYMLWFQRAQGSTFPGHIVQMWWNCMQHCLNQTMLRQQDTSLKYKNNPK